MEKNKFIHLYMSRLSQVSYSNENVIDTSFKRCHQLNDVEIRPSGTGLNYVAIRATSAQRLSLCSWISSRMSLLAYSYANIDTSSTGRRDLSRGNFRTLWGIVESPDDNGARGRRWRSSCSPKVFRKGGRGKSSRTGAIVSPVILVTKQLR